MPIIRLVLIIALLLGTTGVVGRSAAQATGTGDTWDNSIPSMPTSRYQFGAAVSGGRIYAVGGYNVGGNLTNVDAYTPGASAWTTQAPTLLPGTSGVVAGPDGKIYTFGAVYNNTGSANAYCFAYGPCYYPLVAAYSPDTWTQVATQPSPHVVGGAATGSDGRIYLFGGINSTTSELATVDVYDPTSAHWSSPAPMPTARDAFTVIAGPDGRIYVIGGENPSNGGTFLTTVEAYTPATNSWATVASLPSPRMDAAAAVGPDGRVYVIGGDDGSHFLSTVVAYNPGADTWTAVASMTTARMSAAATGSDGRIYVMGGDAPSGIGNGGMIVNTVEAYTAGPQSWPGAPSGLHAVPTRDTVTLTWSAPGIPGSSAVAGYDIAVSDGRHTPITAHVDGNTYQKTLTGLSPSTTYATRVTASNGAGPGIPAATAFTTSPITAPNSPLGLQVVPGNGSVTVNWSLPSDDGGSLIQGYDISASDGVHPPSTMYVPALGTCDPATPTGCSALLTGLTNLTTYTVSIDARNAIGPSLPATTSVRVGPPRYILLVHGYRQSSFDIAGGSDTSFQTLLQALRGTYGSDHVKVFDYYQDLGYRTDPTNPASCASRDSATSQQPAPNTDTGPLFAHPDSINPLICDSQDALAYNATRLDDQIAQLPGPVAIIAYSMGAASTRGWLTLAQSRPNDQALKKVDTIIFMNGVQQGSYLGAANQYLLQQSAAIAPVVNTIYQSMATSLGFDESRPAAADLTPQGGWVRSVNPTDVPQNIHYFNFYSDIALTFQSCFLVTCFINHPIVSADIGDTVILPGTGAPTDMPPLGGARFLPGGANTIDRHEYRIGREYDFNMADISLTDGAGAALKIHFLMNDPVDHLNIPSHLNDPAVLVTTCSKNRIQHVGGFTTDQLTIQSEIMGILADPAHACT